MGTETSKQGIVHPQDLLVINEKAVIRVVNKEDTEETEGTDCVDPSLSATEVGVLTLDAPPSSTSTECVIENTEAERLTKAVAASPDDKKVSTTAQLEHVEEDLRDTMSNPSQVTDHEAAIQFLVVMRSSFGNGAWPCKALQLNDLIVRHSQSSSMDKFAVWARNQRQQNGAKIAKIRKRLLLPLDHLGAFRRNRKSISWNREKVENIIQRSHTIKSTIETTSVQSATVVAGELHRLMMPMANVVVIQTSEQFANLERPFPIMPGNEIVAVDCEGVPEELFLIQVGTRTCTFVFDCVKLGAKIVCDFLREMLTSKTVVKLFHDLHNDAAALAMIGGIEALDGTFDTQLALESITGKLHVGFNDVLQELGRAKHASKRVMKRQMNNGQLFAKRPLPPDVLQYAVDDVRLLLDAYESLRERLGSRWNEIQRASDIRARTAAANGGTRHICFDVPNSYAVASYELLFVLRPDDMMTPMPLTVSNDSDTLLAMLPKDLNEFLHDHTHELSDVVLDKGRRPHAWIRGSRLLLGDDNRLVQQEEIDAVVDKLGGFGSDNRAGLERQLHRISAIRNRESEIIGLTLRFGRHVSGNTGIISDLLFGDTTKSILFLGEPGAGKTTVVREVTRLLADRSNVCIVDTSNEIAGDGDISHPCVGFARRMMVPSLDRQSAVMIECVQNHTPEVMVIDEIGRPTEVEAARTCRNRGVRLIASAHGDLRKLIKNPKLRGLIGGVETVTLGDMQAKAEAKKQPGGTIQKTKAERAGPPTFDILVELKRGAHHEWRVVLDSGDAVDRILRGEEYKVQRRTRNPDTGTVHLELGTA